MTSRMNLPETCSKERGVFKVPDIKTYRVKSIEDRHFNLGTIKTNITGILIIQNDSSVLFKMDDGVNFKISKLKFKPRLRGNRLILAARGAAYIFEILGDGGE